MNFPGSTPDYISAARPDSMGSNAFDISKLLLTVWRRLYVVVALFVLGICLGYTLVRFVPARYSSSVSILIDPRRPGSIGADETFANMFIDTNKISTVQEVLVSSGLLSKVVQAEDLAADPEFSDPRPSIPHRWLELLPKGLTAAVPELRSPQPETLAVRQARALDRLVHAVRTARVGMTYVIVVDVTASSPARAQGLAQAVASAYLNEQVDQKFAEAQRDADWLTKRLAQLRDDMMQSEQAVEGIRCRYGLTPTDVAPGSTVGRQTITQINAELAKAEEDVASRQAKYEQAERIRRSGGDLAGLSEVTSSKLIESLREQQASLDRQIADLAAHYTPTYPGLIRAEHDLKVLNTEIAAEVSRIVDGLRNDAQAAAAHRDALKRQLSELVGQSNAGPSLEGRAQLLEAERVVEANRTVYADTLARLKSVEEQNTRQDAEARIISPASEPTAPSSPKPVMFLGGGGALGMLVGLGLVVVPTLLERRVISGTLLQGELALPILSVIPLLTRRELRRRVKPLSVAEHLACNPLSSFAESLRALQSRLPTVEEGTPRVVQITSTVPGEGKTTIAASIAISYAASGVRTVLVDLDFYKQSISRTFDLKQREGVADVILGNAVDDSALQRHESLPLRIISAGSTRHPCPDLMGTQQFRAFIRGLTAHSDIVVLDTPPVLAVSNAVMASSVADLTILTVAWRQTTRRDVRQAVETLRSAGAPLAGIVLNKTNLAKISRYEGRRYGYRSYAYDYETAGRANRCSRNARRLLRRQDASCSSARLGTTS